MTEIEFTAETPVSFEIMNQLQKNIKEAIDGTVLFENWAGVSGDVDLEDDYTEYSKLRIYAGKGEVGITQIEIPRELYDQKIDVIQGQYINSIYQIICKQFYLEDTYLKVYSSPAYINFQNKEIIEQGLENRILVYKVVGFK